MPDQHDTSPDQKEHLLMTDPKELTPAQITAKLRKLARKAGKPVKQLRSELTAMAAKFNAPLTFAVEFAEAMQAATPEQRENYKRAVSIATQHGMTLPELWALTDRLEQQGLSDEQIDEFLDPGSTQRDQFGVRSPCRLAIPSCSPFTPAPPMAA